MAESENQGISRRDLLKRGAALGGAVVWATPVVQTLGMGRAFAQTASPTDVSYIAFWWNCGDGWLFAKNENDGSEDGNWESDPGNTPGCTEPSAIGDAEVTGVDGSNHFIISWDGGCATVTVQTGCDTHYAAKGGQDPCQTGTLTNGSTTEICLPVT